jgi:magnesium chelatase subunit H
MIGMVCGPAIAKLTKLGSLDMSAPDSGVAKPLKGLRGKSTGKAAGAGQLKMLKRLPEILRFLPGKAQNLRTYFLCMQCWLGGSDADIEAMLTYLVGKCAAGPRAVLRSDAGPAKPVEHPDVGCYHPDMPGRLASHADLLPRLATHADLLPRPANANGTIGVLVMRACLLAGDTAHCDAVIRALEARGLAVRAAFASGLDARPAVEMFLSDENRPDAPLSPTGFSLVGGPAFDDSPAAEAMLAKLDIPYVAAHAWKFQTLERWGGSGSGRDRGLGSVEAAMMTALPELDGATGPLAFGGRGGAQPAPEGPDASGGKDGVQAMQPCAERIERLADRIAKLAALRRSTPCGRKVAIALCGFAPNAGAVGSAADLAVFEALFNMLDAMKAEGYALTPPKSPEELRRMILDADGGRIAAIAARIPADSIVREDPCIAKVEAQWGPAPGRVQANGAEVFVLGRQIGDVFVGVQPGFGHEGDPMRLLFEKGFAPTHAFAAFHRWIRDDFAADAVLHFGMHGALEFMPGKQSGLSGACWPGRLIADLPNIYLHAANTPSEAALAKRRSAATIITHLTPPLSRGPLQRADRSEIHPRPLAQGRCRGPRARRARGSDPGRGPRARSVPGRAGVGESRGRGRRPLVQGP